MGLWSHKSLAHERECLLVLRLVASTQKWIHQTEERVIREINSCESERLREGEREAQTGQEEMRAAMRADTPALEASQQYEPDAKGGEGKGGETDLERHPSLLRQTALRLAK